MDRDCKVSEKETAVLEAETDKLGSTVRKACSGEAYRKEPTGCRDRYCTYCYCCQKNRALPCTGQREVWRRYRESKRFLNRLSDYLYILARYIEYSSDLSVELSDDHAGALVKTSDNNTDALPEPSDSNTDVLKKKTADINEAVIQEGS